MTDEKNRNGICWVLAAVFAPVFMIAAILCSAVSGGADHNNLPEGGAQRKTTVQD